MDAWEIMVINMSKVLSLEYLIKYGADPNMTRVIYDCHLIDSSWTYPIKYSYDFIANSF